MLKELAAKHPYWLGSIWLGTVVTVGSVLISHFATRGADAPAPGTPPPPTPVPSK